MNKRFAGIRQDFRENADPPNDNIVVKAIVIKILSVDVDDAILINKKIDKGNTFDKYDLDTAKHMATFYMKTFYVSAETTIQNLIEEACAVWGTKQTDYSLFRKNKNAKVPEIMQKNAYINEQLQDLNRNQQQSKQNDDKEKKVKLEDEVKSKNWQPEVEFYLGKFSLK